jgi:hypothetical protein
MAKSLVRHTRVLACIGIVFPQDNVTAVCLINVLLSETDNTEKDIATENCRFITFNTYGYITFQEVLLKMI